MSFATGMSWLKHRRDYELKFGQQVPDWVCMYDLPVRLPDQVLVRDEFQQGAWGLWGR